MPDISINAERFLRDLNTLRAFGACGKGVVRPAFSDADIQSRLWLLGRMQEAGLQAKMDPAGNVFGLPKTEGRALLLGSHADSQPEGGWLDGAFGVIAALEVARAAIEAGGPAIAVAAFQDEEGRFGPLTGSKIWAGGMSLSEADRLTDSAGMRFAEARQRISDVCEDGFVPPDRFSGYIEAHIEQGIVLDRAGLSIGVVDSIVGIRTETFSFCGVQNHAGTTPMRLRQDAFQGLVEFASQANERLEKIVTPTTVWTIGRVDLHPNEASIIPGEVKFTVQWRDGDDALLGEMRDVLHAAAEDAARKHGVSVQRSNFFSYPATQIDRTLRSRIERSADRLAKGQWMGLPSGALHDAANLSRHLPVAMLFVPSIGGKSHSFDEDTAPDHLILGAQILAASALV